MRINYITGRGASGKTHDTYQKIKEKIESGSEKIILLVPEQFTLQAEVDLINKMNLKGLMNVQVLSFQRLAFRVLSEVGGVKKNIITDLGKIMTLRKVFEENKENLKIFKKVYSQEGFLKEFSGFISELRKSGITEGDIKEHIPKLKNDVILGNKFSDISLIYEKFAESIAGDYIDEDETLNLLAEKLSASDVIDGAELWIDGFNSFSQQEYKIMEGLFLKCKEISVTLTLDNNFKSKDYDLFDPTLSTYRKIKKISQYRGLQENDIVMNGSFITSKELAHLEKNMYAYPAQKYSSEVKDIKIISALNQYSEVEDTALHIINLVREHDYKWKDISVVTNALETYGSIIKRVFAEYEIPVFIDEKRKVSNNPLINYIKSTLKIISNDYHWEDVFQHFKTGLSDLTNNEIENLENYILEYGIKGKSWRDGFSYIKNQDKEEEKTKLENLNSYREKTFINIEALSKKIKKKNTGRNISKGLFEFLMDTNIFEKIENKIHDEKEKGNYEFVNENSQIWNIVMKVLDQIAEIIDGKEIDVKEYLKIIESGFNSYELGLIPPTMDQVLVGNLERSKSHDIKALFLLGCNDGIIPRTFSDGGIVLDNEKLKMQELGLGIYSDNSSQMKEEKFLVYSAFTKPSEKLFISFSLGDLEGKALRPSLLIERIKKIFDIEVESDLVFSKDPFEKSTSRPLPSYKFFIENIRENLDYGIMDQRWWSVYQWFYNNEAWDNKRKVMIQGLFHENQVNKAGEKLAKGMYSSVDRYSISRLETYANCPFKHFLKYGLRAKERREYKVELPDIGTLFHDSLEVFPEKLKEEKLEWKNISPEHAEIFMEEIIETISKDFHNGLLESSSRNKYLKEKLKRVSKRAISTLTLQLQKGEFQPWKFELPFKDIFNEEKNIFIEGRIDRLDLWKDKEDYYIRVIDYKSGNKKFNIRDIYYLLQLQLIIYLSAAIFEGKNELGRNVKPGGAFYFKIDDPIVENENSEKNIVEEKIKKILKMDGFLLKDKEILNAMDKDVEESKDSDILSVKLKGDGEFYANASVFEEKELEIIIKYVKESIGNIVSEITKGEIKIEPCKSKTYLSCNYCEYPSVCQFDTSLPNNNYKILENIDKNEVIQSMEEKVINNGKLDS